MQTTKFNNAPKIKENGQKKRNPKNWGLAIRSHELETAIMNGLGERDMAMLKIMLFLTGNAPGFAVAEATICERCKISHKGYVNARVKLEAMGWITLIKNDSIIVNYDVIYNSYFKSEETKDDCGNEEKTNLDEKSTLGTEVTPEIGTQVTHNNIKNTINNKISGGEILSLRDKTPLREAADEVDVVTTVTTSNFKGKSEAELKAMFNEMF